MTGAQDDMVDERPADDEGPGGSGAEHPDVDSTTGSAAEREEHVGRVAGDDVGYAGETGAERRAEG